MDPPLDGLLVVDLSRLYPGPFATSVLGALGARVVKVEDPRAGDYARWLPPEDAEGHGFAFTPVNRGKESLAVDTRTPEGAEVVLRLADRADVLVESFRPGVLARAGLGAEHLLRRNPRLVVLSLVGYAPDSPRADEPGHDLNYQALAGSIPLDATGAAATPRAQVADVAGALYGATAVLAALVARGGTGRGRHVVVALSDAAVAANTLALARARAKDDGVDELTGDLPAYATYRCRDGRDVVLGALEPKFWAAFVEAAGRKDVAEAGFAVGDAAAKAQVAAIFAERTSDEWLALCRAAAVPATPVLAPAEAARAALRLGPGAPLGVGADAPAPRQGEHTDAVLAELGFTKEEREAMRAKGVVG